MTYRSLLVLLDADAQCAVRTRLAMKLAVDLDCHLVGIAPTGLIDLPLATSADSSLGAYAALAWDTLRAQAEGAAARFREDCGTAGLKSFEAVVDDADKGLSIVRHAHCSDLTVLSQADPATSGHRGVQNVVEQVVMHSARPTLVLPYAGRFDDVGERILVAWDDSREAARAVSDALPLLRRAKSVQVVSWKEGRQQPDTSVPSHLDALRQWLMWQGVGADVRSEMTAIGIADAMLSRACDLNADLIVMGAYGHTRLAERILGGATRGLLASMTVPVLMSH
jgi:nucleotide-binding universal stress UspA family protein